jgi:hypothetical protein
MKLGTETGSLVNHVMSKAGTKPEVGKGATELLWSDRHAYFVNEVSKDKKECVIERAKAVRTDKNGMSECQDYEYHRDPNAVPIKLRFRYKQWMQQDYDEIQKKFVYTKINIKFGFMQEYYDFSF